MTSRFRVSSVAGGREGEVDPSPLPSTAPSAPLHSVALSIPEKRPDDGGERIPLCEQHSPLALYDDDYDKGRGQKIGHMLKSLSGYNETLPTSAEVEDKAAPKKMAQLGTLMGVLLPCLQNIFGVLFFIRLSWIIGTAGILNGLVVVLTCVSVTFLTSISLSAIATNGVVSGGGPYYMISRNLGPELGGAVGILFYLGTTIAGSMYITGGVEIIILYLFPGAKIFDDIFHNFRLYGSCLLLLLGLIVLAGVRVVNKFALPVVFIVLACIFSVFLGIFVRMNGSDHLKFCMVGSRPVDIVGYMEQSGLPSNVTPKCDAEHLRELFCAANGTCDKYFLKAMANKTMGIREEQGIKGLTSGVFWENLWPKYLREGDVLQKLNATDDTKKEEERTWYIYADISTSFMVLVGVFFPSATGIMAGSNRSGNLRDAAKSIPLGTLGAQLMTSFVYLAAVFLVGGTASEMLLRDKLGSSAMGKLTMAELAWPSPRVIVFGSLLATLGAGLQSLTGAPRLLQAIAADGVIPFLAPFRSMDSRGEPIKAIFLTLFICELGILIAVIENIAALITQFFLMCYLGVNTACALQSVLRAPGWRPGFKFFHWSLSMVGAVLCVAVMFISAWHYALIAIVIGAGVYKYIEYVGAEKEWGDGIRGLRLSAARFALLNLEEKQEHTRNWRPQLLVMMESLEDSAAEGVLSMVSQLKAGKGLTMMVHCLQGDYTQQPEHAEELKQEMRRIAKKHKIKGFCDVLMAKNAIEGLSCCIQTAGLGGLRHNSVLINWPQEWAAGHDEEVGQRLISIVRATSAANCAVIVTKGAENFPRNTDRINGFIDVWWIVHDGGLLMLLPFLLKQHKVWRSCTLRLFVIATMEENNLQMKNDLQKFLYQLRISAQVNVIEMTDTDISDYTYERTLKMEERSRLLKEMKERTQMKDLQMHMDDVTRERKLSKINEEDARAFLETRLNEDKASDEGLAGVVEKPTLDSVAEERSDEEDLRPNKSNGRGVRFSEEENVVPAEKNHVEEKASGMEALRRRRRYNVHKMHTAVRLNELMRSHSSEAQLVVVNLPGAPRADADSFYMDFIEALTESLDRVLLVRGTGAEVVTIYS